MKQNIIYVILALILIIGALVRFCNLTEKGLAEPDEASYFHKANTSVILARWVRTNNTALKDINREERRDLGNYFSKKHIVPYGDLHFKPFYIFLAGIASLVGGSTYHSILNLNAILGTLTILFLYLIIQKLYGNKLLSLLASLIFSLSALHIIWSRSGLAQASSIFFLSAGMLIYAYCINREYGSKKNAYYIFCSLIFGVAIACHINVIPFIIAIWFTELFTLIKTKGIKQFIKNSVLFFMPLFLLLAGINLLTICYKNFLNTYFSWLFFNGAPLSFFEQLSVSSKDVLIEGYVLRQKISPYLIQNFLYGEGPFVSVLILVGFLYLLIKLFRYKATPDFLIVAPFVISLGFYFIGKILPHARNIAALGLFSALVAAIFIKDFHEKISYKYKKLFAVGFVLLFVAVQLNYILPLLKMKSGFKLGSDWLHTRNENAIAVSSRPDLWEVHGIKAFDIEKEPRERISYVAVCQNQYLSPRRNERILRMAKARPPVVVFDNVEPFTLQKKNLFAGLARMLDLLNISSLDQKLEKVNRQMDEINFLNAIKIYEI